MKINTKKTKVLRVSKESESDNEDSSCRGNYRTSQGILLLDPGQKNFDFYRQISEKFHFFQAILQKNIEFCRQISEIFYFFRQLKKFDFPSQKLSIGSSVLLLSVHLYA